MYFIFSSIIRNNLCHVPTGGRVTVVISCWVADGVVYCWCKAVTLDGTLYKVSGEISGGMSDLVFKASQWSLVSSEQSEARATRRRAIHDELSQLYRTETRRRQPSSQIVVSIDAQNKLLQVAEEQKKRLVRLGISNLVHELMPVASPRSGVTGVGRCTKLGLNENNSSDKNDMKYIPVATTKLQQLLSKTSLKCFQSLSAFAILKWTEKN